MNRVAVIASASGNGKTTLGRRLADQLGVQFVELDALVHGANWMEAPDEKLLEALRPVVAADGWVIDGNYFSKLGDTVLASADTVVWLDLPIRVWLPRLARRTLGRVHRRKPLWNGNRQTIRGAIGGPNALIPFALRSHRRRRRTYPALLAPFHTIRLRTEGEVERFLSEAGGP